VVTLALGPSGRAVYADRAGHSDEMATVILDTARARRTRVLTSPADGTSLALAVRLDGHLLAMGDHGGRPALGFGDRYRDLVLGDEVTALAFGTGGSRPAAGGGAGRVALWDGRLRQRAGILHNVFPAPLGQPEAHQLLTELSMFALRTPHLKEALHSHYSEVLAVTAKLIDEAAERTGHQLAQSAETIARFFLAGFDGLTMQHLSLPDEEAERVCLRALVSAVLAMA
jgi:hypothetical protein